MKWQSEIAYLPKFPKTMTNLFMIMISMLMIKNILKFKILIMILPMIMTHLWKYALLYHVRWYHCSKQELRRNRSKSRSDVIVDDICIISMVFDRMCYKDYDSSVNLSYGLFFLKSNMVARGGVRRSLKPKLKPKLEYHSSIATCIPYIPFYVSSWYYRHWQSYGHSNIRAIWWNCDPVLWPMILKSLVSWDRFLICIP